MWDSTLDLCTLVWNGCQVGRSEINMLVEQRSIVHNMSFDPHLNVVRIHKKASTHSIFTSKARKALLPFVRSDRKWFGNLFMLLKLIVIAAMNTSELFSKNLYDQYS